MPLSGCRRSALLPAQMLQKGTLLPPLDALRVGLVDEVAPADLVVERAVVVAAELLAVPFAAR